MTKVYIYGLFDPRTNELRYIGKANNPEIRLRGHIAEARIKRGWNSHKENWMRQLLSEGFIPCVEIIEETNDTEWQERERFWIAFYKRNNVRLTNITSGGDGRVGAPLSEEARRKLSMFHKGRKYSEEVKMRLRGRVPSDETKRKISNALKGRTLSREVVERARNAFLALGYKHTEETKQKIAEGNRGKIVSEETRAKLSEGNKGKKRTQEQIQRNIEAKKAKRLERGDNNYKFTDEHKLKIKAGLLGHKLSEETKAKISLTKRSKQ